MRKFAHTLGRADSTPPPPPHVLGILTELLHNKNKGINLHVGVFNNFITVLLQFYAQFYSDSIQIYHCKNYIISLYFYHIIKFQLKICAKAEV